MSRQVTCITKGDYQSRENIITHIGGSWGTVSTQEAIRQIENGSESYYVSVSGHRVNVIVSSRNGVKYLKTEGDSDTVDNLLSLPSC